VALTPPLFRADFPKLLTKVTSGKGKKSSKKDKLLDREVAGINIS
jgi:hypothetical protein